MRSGFGALTGLSAAPAHALGAKAWLEHGAGRVSNGSASLSYRDNGDGTVTDVRAGLTWEKKTDLNVNNVYSWDDAFAYVAELNAMNGGAGFAGHDDWRVPDVRELLSIVDYGRANPSIHPTFGPTAGVLTFVMYWTSTSWAGYQPEYNAWAVNFRDSSTDLAGMLPFGKASFNRVRAVRGGR